MKDTQQQGASRAPVPAPGPFAGVFSVAASVLLLSVGATYAFGLLVAPDQPPDLAGAQRLAVAGVAAMRLGGCTLLLGLLPGVIGFFRHESPRWPSLLGIALGVLGGLLVPVGLALVGSVPGSL